MWTMKQIWGLDLALMAGVLALPYSAAAKPSMSHDGASHRLARRGAFGRIIVQPSKENIWKLSCGVL